MGRPYHKLLVLSVISAVSYVTTPEHRVRVQAHQQLGSVEKLVRPQALPAERPTFALEGTDLLKVPVSENIYEEQRQQIIRYFTKQIAATPAKRDSRWQTDLSSLDSYMNSVEKHRANLRVMLGLIQPKLGTPKIEVLREEGSMRVADVTIPIDAGLSARALCFLPRSSTPGAGMIAIPPADKSREEFAGIVEGATPAQWLRTLLANNISVAVPLMVERRDDHPLCRHAGGKDRRRILWRAGFIVGRTLVGVEVQQVLALKEFLASQGNVDPRRISVIGEGQGGMTALFAGAMDEGVAGVAAVDYFQQREICWKEPVDQVLYGQLNEFGDAEVAALVSPRPLEIVHTSRGPIPAASVKAEFTRAQRFYAALGKSGELTTLEAEGDPLNTTVLKMASLLAITPNRNLPEITIRVPRHKMDEARNQQFEALLQYLRGLCDASDQVRTEYWQLNFTPPEDRPQKVHRLQSELAKLEGVISYEDVPMHPRTALIAETDKFLAYDVFLDLVSGVEVYGQLWVPRPVAGHMESRHPAVVCQHGFDGGPKYVSGVGTNLKPMTTSITDLDNA